MLTASINGSAATASQLETAFSNPYRSAASSARAVLASAMAASRTGGSPRPKTVVAWRKPAAWLRPAIPAPMTATEIWPSAMAVLSQIVPDLLQVVHRGFAGSFLPGEDAHGVDAADEVDRGPAVLDEVVRMRFEDQPDALALEDGEQFLQRPPELGLAGRGRIGPAVELGVHRVRAEVRGDLDGPFPVPHRGLALVLVRAGPPVQRQHRGDLHPGRGQGPGERGDLRLVRPRVQEEGQEILSGRELDVLGAQVRDQAREFGQRDPAEHVGVESDFHLA